MRLTPEQVREHQRRHGFTDPIVVSPLPSEALTKQVESFDAGVAHSAEKKLQQDAAKWLILHGAAGLVWHRTDQRTTCSVGVSDFVFLWKGKYVAAEAKIGRNKPTRAQLEFLYRVNAAGGRAFVFHSVEELRDNLV